MLANNGGQATAKRVTSGDEGKAHVRCKNVKTLKLRRGAFRETSKHTNE